MSEDEKKNFKTLLACYSNACMTRLKIFGSVFLMSYVGQYFYLRRYFRRNPKKFVNAYIVGNLMKFPVLFTSSIGMAAMVTWYYRDSRFKACTDTYCRKVNRNEENFLKKLSPMLEEPPNGNNNNK